MWTSSRPWRLRSTSSRSGRDVANTQRMRPRLRVSRHLLGEHRVDAAGQAAVAVAALALARRLIGFVDEHHDLAERAQHREDLLEVRLGRADPAIAEVLEDDARDAELARPALHEERLAGADAAGRSDSPSAARAARPCRSSVGVLAQPGLDRVVPGDVVERERRLDEIEQALALALDQLLLDLRRATRRVMPLAVAAAPARSPSARRRGSGR